MKLAVSVDVISLLETAHVQMSGVHLYNTNTALSGRRFIDLRGWRLMTRSLF
jgi:hypothetical protein